MYPIIRKNIPIHMYFSLCLYFLDKYDTSLAISTTMKKHGRNHSGVFWDSFSPWPLPYRIHSIDWNMLLDMFFVLDRFD